MRRIFDPASNTIYVDLDGVLADFDKLVLDNLGREFPHTTNDLEKEDEEMWIFLKNVPQLYLNLDPTPYAFDLWNHIKSFGAHVEILTAIPRRHYIPEAEQNKRDWVAKHLGGDVKVNIGPFSADKWKFAKPADILVDDRTDNIQQWINHGSGIGIVHYYRDHLNTIERITAMVTELDRLHG